MSETGKAVFLSYASQDADAARRICESLRGAGVEVWFDADGGLEHGDEWDAKIRRQIKDCVLFIPLISANTQARHEGYFRIEWDLAAERARGIAAGVAFILPIIIDATREPEALVPDRFRAVQWTRLPGGVMAPEGLARFVKLWSHRAGVVKQSELEAGRPRSAPRDEDGVSPAETVVGRRVPAAAWVGVAVLVATVLVVGGYFWLKRAPEPRPISAQQAGAGTHSLRSGQAQGPRPTEKIPAARDWPRGAELKRVIALIDGLDATREDFRLAEEIATRALNQAPADPETVTVLARVHSAFVLRNFDFSAERNALAKKYGERAVQLAPDEPEALYALAVFLAERGANAVRAVTLAQRATELAPTEPRYWRTYARAVEARESRSEDGLALAEQNVVRFPRDALVHYELAIVYRFRERWADFERELDATIALAPLANAINWKARAAMLRGDLAEMRQWLDRVPARARTEERTVISSIIYASLSGDYDYGLAALQGFAEPWFYDAFNYSGPTALPRAEILARQGKPGLARVHYEAALAELKRRQAESPSDFTGRSAEIWTLLGLGRREEALALHRTAMEAARRPWRVTALGSWWFDTIPRALLSGDRETALALMREAAVESEGRRVIKLRMKWDVRMAPFRDEPEIVALLAEPAAEAGGKKTGVTAAPLSEGAQLAARALALFTKVGFLRDDLGPAEDLARRATEKEPDNAAAWGVRAGVQSAWILRNWDTSEKRRQEAQAFANRALSLDPNEPEALLGLAHVLRRQGALEQAEALLRRAIAANPNHVRLGRMLGFTLFSHGRNDEARAVLQELARRVPRDPLVRYELAMTYGDYGHLSAEPDSASSAIAQFDAAIRLQPFSSALLAKAVLLAGWRGDLPGMRAALDQHEKLSLVDRSEDRAVCVVMWAGLLEHRPDRVEAAAALTARNYFDDSAMPLRPKAWSLALAHRIAGKTNSARNAWEAAEAVLRQRLKEDPASQRYQLELATTLAWLDQREEAERLVDVVEPLWKENRSAGQERVLARYYAARGDAKRAAPYLPAVVDQTPFTSRKVIPLDPWWDKIRGAPEFESALKEAEAKK